VAVSTDVTTGLLNITTKQPYSIHRSNQNVAVSTDATTGLLNITTKQPYSIHSSNLNVAVSTDATTGLLNIDVRLQQACSTFHLMRTYWEKFGPHVGNMQLNTLNELQVIIRTVTAVLFLYIMSNNTLLALQPPVGQDLLIHRVSRSHTTHHSR
jgi:hypothetical protein